MGYECAVCSHSASAHASDPNGDQCFAPCTLCGCGGYEGPLDVASAGDVALCDVCEQRPGTHSLMTAGSETWACDECSEVKP